MRAVALLALLLVTIGCDADYDPPKPYAIGAYYSGTGRSFGSTLGGVQFLDEDASVLDTSSGAKDTGGGDAAEEIAADLSEAYFTCIADFDVEASPEVDYPGYCLCVEGTAVDSEEETMCKCEFLVCVEDYDAVTYDAMFGECYWLVAGGQCAGPQ